MRASTLIIITIGLGIAAQAGCDADRKEARTALEQWLGAHVARDFKRVVALTADVTFADVARQQRVAVAQVRSHMPKLLALAPEKLTDYELVGSGKREREGVYAFVVRQQTLKQKKKGRKRERVYVVREAGAWRIDPTRTTPASQ